MSLMIAFCVWCALFLALLSRVRPAAPAAIEPPRLTRRNGESSTSPVEWNGDAPSEEVMLCFFGEVPSVEETLAAQYDAVARKRKVQTVAKPKSPAEASRAAKAVHRGPLQFRTEPVPSVALDTELRNIDDCIELLSLEQGACDESHDPTL